LGTDGVERDVGCSSSPADSLLVTQVERQELEVVLRAEINWCSRVVHRLVAWIRSWDLATRTSDHLTKAVDLVVCEEPDFVESIKALLVDDDLRRGYTSEADALRSQPPLLDFGSVGVLSDV
jgi:hypothetical protein